MFNFGFGAPEKTAFNLINCNENIAPCQVYPTKKHQMIYK
jgi:hypothetical protein